MGKIRLLAATLVLGLAGCGGEAVTAEPAPAVFEVRDPWVKAADQGMTAAFATLVNRTGADVTVVEASSAVSPMELHEMGMRDGAMVMRPKAGGVTVKAGGSHVLEPGGDHLMLMDLNKPVRPGDEITITLTFADGGTSEFRAIVKPFTGAQESYAPDAQMTMAPA